MSRVIDLDARRKAVAGEAKKEPMTVRLNGETFTLPAEMPLAFAYYLQNMELLKAARSLVGEKDAERFLDANPSAEDLEAIVEGYGISLGEASGSPSSSTSTGKKSKRTSSGSTASISPAQ